jgi:membrane protein YqaA with SNARE-associated domain
VQSVAAALERGKAWLEEMAGRRYALALLFLVAFIEASVAPVPPDLLFLPLALAKPRRSFIPASVCIIGSVSGAVLGYFIGMEFYDTIGLQLLEWTGAGKHFDVLLGAYHENGFITLLLAGFTPSLSSRSPRGSNRRSARPSLLPDRLQGGLSGSIAWRSLSSSSARP